MLYPIFLDVLSNIKISVGPPFFNIVIIPFVVPLMFLMAIGPKFGWIKSQNKIFYKILFLIIGSVIINLFIVYFFGKYSLLSNLILIAAIFLILNSFLDIKRSINRKNKFELSRITSHLGFGLLIFFIGINNQFSLEEDFNLIVGEKKTFQQYKIDFKSLKTKEEKNYKAVVGEFIFLNTKNNVEEILNPEIRIYNNPKTLTYEAAIKTKISSDIYLTMSNISRSDYYNIKFQKKPFMMWIWLSAILISIGGFLRLTKKKITHEI
jgi:cytochrome c-type biogenesis protein CcmF